MNEEEKNKIAFELARQGIDLEKLEELSENLLNIMKPVFNLAVKNRKVIDRYCDNEVK